MSSVASRVASPLSVVASRVLASVPSVAAFPTTVATFPTTIVCTTPALLGARLLNRFSPSVVAAGLLVPRTGLPHAFATAPLAPLAPIIPIGALPVVLVALRRHRRESAQTEHQHRANRDQHGVPFHDRFPHPGAALAPMLCAQRNNIAKMGSSNFRLNAVDSARRPDARLGGCPPAETARVDTIAYDMPLDTIRRWLGLDQLDRLEAPEQAPLRDLVETLEHLEPGRARHLSRFAYLLGRVAHADRHVSPEETRAMEAIVAQEGALTSDQAIVVVGLAKSSNVLFGGTADFQVAQEFAEGATYDEKLALARCLFRVASTDRSISIAEESEIHRIANHLKILPHDLTALRVSHATFLPGLSSRPR